MVFSLFQTEQFLPASVDIHQVRANCCRLDRDGTDFESVDVFLPMTEVSLPNGDRWSWCRSKLIVLSPRRYC